jgi:hypothetical protein
MINANFKTFDDMMRAALAIWPDAIFQEDTDGEIFILTGYKNWGKNGQVRTYKGQ